MLWNSLPQDVVMGTSTNGFKRELDNVIEVRFNKSHLPRWCPPVVQGLYVLECQFLVGQQHWGRAAAAVMSCFCGIPVDHRVLNEAGPGGLSLV